MPPKDTKKDSSSDKKKGGGGGGSAAAAASSAPAAAASSSTAAPPTGEIVTITPTLSQMNNLKADVIRNPEALKTIKRLQELRSAQSKGRDELRSLINQQQASRGSGGGAGGAGGGSGSSQALARNKQLDGIDAEFERLQEEKRNLNREMDVLRLEQTQVQRDSDRKKILDVDMDAAVRAARPARQKLEDMEDRLADLIEKRDSKAGVEHGGYASASAAEEELQKLAKQIENATQKNDTQLITALSRQQVNVQRAKREWVQALAVEDNIFSLEQQIAKQKKTVDEANKKVNGVDDERDTVRDNVKNAKSFGDAFQRVRDKLARVNKQMDDNRDKRRSILGVKKDEDAKKKDPAVEERSKAIDAKRKEQDELAAELDALRTSGGGVTIKKMSFDPELRSDLIGRRGATVTQLQSDFGVSVDFDVDGFAVVVGGNDDVDAALDAIKQMCAALRNSRYQEVIKFDPTQASQIIGSGGSNINRMQTLSGAIIKVDSSAGTATIKGTPEVVAAAKQLFDEHFKNNAEVAIPFSHDLIDVILGKGGATVRKCEQESGARRIRVDKDNSVLYGYGPQEACDKVKAFYSAIILEWNTPPVTMKIDERMIRTVIGKGGATIAEIQSSSGASVSVKHPTGGAKNGSIIIRGKKDAIESAKKQIEDLVHREEVKVPVPSALFNVLIDIRGGKNSPSSAAAAKNGDKDDGDDKQQEEEGADAAAAAASAAGNKNNNKKPTSPTAANNKPCVLEEIKLSTLCDQVSLIKSDSVVVIRGKRDQIAQARMQLERFLLEHRPDVVKISFNPVLFNPLTDRGNSSRTSVVDAIVSKVKSSHPSSIGGNFLNTEIIRSTSTLEVAGLDKAQVAAAAAELRAKLEELGKQTRSMVVSSGSVPVIVGSGGSRIRDLQSRHRAEINIQRDKGEVSVFASSEENLKNCVDEIEQLVSVKA